MADHAKHFAKRLQSMVKAVEADRERFYRTVEGLQLATGKAARDDDDDDDDDDIDWEEVAFVAILILF